MRGIKKVSTAGMSREAWLEQRRHTIGGSDAAGIIGLSKWSSPMSVWADKTGRLPDKPDTEAMRLGRDLEGYVASRWMESTGKKVRRLNAMLYSELYPFAHADIDREVIGERAGLECKTTSTLDVKQFQGGVPGAVLRPVRPLPGRHRLRPLVSVRPGVWPGPVQLRAGAGPGRNRRPDEGRGGVLGTGGEGHSALC